MGKGTAKLYVSRDVLSRAIAAGETAEKGSGCIEFAKTIMRLTAQESCGIHLGLVLQDLQKSTNGEIVQSFCSSAGNFIMKILHRKFHTVIPRLLDQVPVILSKAPPNVLAFSI